MKITCCDKCGKEINEEDMTHDFLSKGNNETISVEICWACAVELDEERYKALAKVDMDFYANFKYKNQN